MVVAVLGLVGAVLGLVGDVTSLVGAVLKFGWYCFEFVGDFGAWAGPVWTWSLVSWSNNFTILGPVWSKICPV